MLHGRLQKIYIQCNLTATLVRSWDDLSNQLWDNNPFIPRVYAPAIHPDLFRLKKIVSECLREQNTLRLSINRDGNS